MKTYDFTYLVDADPHADDFEDRFIEAGCDDATFLLMRGAAALSFDREATSFRDAALSAYRDIRRAGADVLRFEPDFLVSAAEIAERAHLSKQRVSYYIKGDRREGFPAPCARVASKNPLWDWETVSQWLVEHQMLEESVHTEAAISRIINASAQMNRVVPTARIDIEAALEAA